MSVITFKQSGNFKSTERFLKRVTKTDFVNKLRAYGDKGVFALYKATPVNTGETAQSWRYAIEQEPGLIRLSWINDYAPNNVQVAVLIQYGHATKNGGWVEGKDYINPAIKPIFDEIVNDLWKEVTG